ncbi:MAG: bifunctional metallophosphatase/5'-nucleotidase, partial [Deltaproteobacteria bacterium]|nr:bifunctional metallophosphatase/5'-nucleotidase [Deltaproteobacteria bacterium]
FLHTSDMHGRLLPYRMQVTLTDEELGLRQELEPFGGIARVAHLVDRERARGGRVLYVETGDVFQGAPIFNAFQGEECLRAMAQLNPDAFVLGNHEFDTGLGNLIEQTRRWVSFPLLAANYYFLEDNALRDYVKPYTIVNRDGLRIGLLGIGDFSSLSSLTDIGNSLKILPLDMAETVRYYVGILRPQVDLLVILSHAGLSHDQELIAATDGVDIVFGGHLHIVLDPPKVAKNRLGEDVLLVHSGAFAKYVGRLDVVLRQDASGRFRVASHDYELFPVDSSVPEDPEMTRLMHPYRLKLNQLIDLTSIFGYSSKLLTKYGYEGGDSSLGNLVSEAIRKFARVEVAFTNTLGIRSNMYPGPVTLDDMYNIFPFDNTITTMYLSGADLRRLFDYVAQRSSGRGCVSQLQVAGMLFTMDCNGDPPPLYYECWDCGHADGEGFVHTGWDGCAADCLKGCGTSKTCRAACLEGFRACVVTHSDRQEEDGVCLDGCLPDAKASPDAAGLDGFLSCLDGCFPRAEDIRITTCPDPIAVEDSTQCATKPLIRDQIYEVATNDYIAKGGSGFTILKSNNTQSDTGLPLREAVLEVMLTSPACVEGCVDRDGDRDLADCPVYNDCLVQVGTFLDGFCDGVDHSITPAMAGDFTGQVMGCGVDTASCEMDADCYPTDRLCADGGCTPCAASAECLAKQANSFCVDGWCVERTVACIRGRCHHRCGEDADCPGEALPGQLRCVGGACHPRSSIPCLTDHECADPYRACFGDAPSCQEDGDCAAGERCQALLCVPADAGPACAGSGCAGACEACDDDAGCAEGLRCMKRRCVSLPALCVDNRCRPRCAGPGDCLPGEGCVEGLCHPLACAATLSGEDLCRTNNLWRAQQRCLSVPCVDSQVDGRIGRILPENLEDLEFGFVPNDPEDLDLDY